MTELLCFLAAVLALVLWLLDLLEREKRIHFYRKELKILQMTPEQYKFTKQMVDEVGDCIVNEESK